MKLNPCPVCNSENLEIDSTACAEIYGVCHQTVWVECLDCGHSCDGANIDEEMSRDEIDLLTLQAWNSFKDSQ